MLTVDYVVSIHNLNLKSIIWPTCKSMIERRLNGWIWGDSQTYTYVCVYIHTNIYMWIYVYLCPLESLRNSYPFLEYVITPAAIASQSSLPSAWHTGMNKHSPKRTNYLWSRKEGCPLHVQEGPNPRTVRTPWVRAQSNWGVCLEGWAGNMEEELEMVIREIFLCAK